MFLFQPKSRTDFVHCWASQCWQLPRTRRTLHSLALNTELVTEVVTEPLNSLTQDSELLRTVTSVLGGVPSVQTG